MENPRGGISWHCFIRGNIGGIIVPNQRAEVKLFGQSPRCRPKAPCRVTSTEHVPYVRLLFRQTVTFGTCFSYSSEIIPSPSYQWLLHSTLFGRKIPVAAFIFRNRAGSACQLLRGYIGSRRMWRLRWTLCCSKSSLPRISSVMLRRDDGEKYDSRAEQVRYHSHDH